MQESKKEEFSILDVKQELRLEVVEEAKDSSKNQDISKELFLNLKTFTYFKSIFKIAVHILCKLLLTFFLSNFQIQKHT